MHYLEPHTQNVKYCHLDIVSFFHSIDVNIVRDTFSVYFSDEFLVKEKQSLLDAFMASVTLTAELDGVEKHSFRWDLNLPHQYLILFLEKLTF